MGYITRATTIGVYSVVPQVVVRRPVLQDFKAFGRQAHVAELDFRTQMYDVQYLIGQLARINVTTMSVVRNEGNVKRADMWYIRETLQEMMLLVC
jgi:hypothetical protein